MNDLQYHKDWLKTDKASKIILLEITYDIKTVITDQGGKRDKQ